VRQGYPARLDPRALKVLVVLVIVFVIALVGILMIVDARREPGSRPLCPNAIDPRCNP
jgi:hypothetical protein